MRNPVVAWTTKQLFIGREATVRPLFAVPFRSALTDDSQAMRGRRYRTKYLTSQLNSGWPKVGVAFRGNAGRVGNSNAAPPDAGATGGGRGRIHIRRLR